VTADPPNAQRPSRSRSPSRGDFTADRAVTGAVLLAVGLGSLGLYRAVLDNVPTTSAIGASLGFFGSMAIVASGVPRRRALTWVQAAMALVPALLMPAEVRAHTIAAAAAVGFAVRRDEDVHAALALGCGPLGALVGAAAAPSLGALATYIAHAAGAARRQTRRGQRGSCGSRRACCSRRSRWWARCRCWPSWTSHANRSPKREPPATTPRSAPPPSAPRRGGTAPRAPEAAPVHAPCART
jgi:hypothetical protein